MPNCNVGCFTSVSLLSDSITLYYTLLHSVTLCYTLLHSVTLYYTLLHSITLSDSITIQTPKTRCACLVIYPLIKIGWLDAKLPTGTWWVRTHPWFPQRANHSPHQVRCAIYTMLMVHQRSSSQPKPSYELRLLKQRHCRVSSRSWSVT